MLRNLMHIALYPLSIIYGFILFIRNKLYDWHILNSIEFKTPVISVGNLNMGGVGKTPHVEYLIKLLGKKFKVATLSRGYKRTTSGFIIANSKSTYKTIGDEPMQYATKYDVIVAVDEKRVRGIKQIKSKTPEIQTIVLDDAYQHRAVKPGINILITDFSKLYINDTVAPSGSLREWATGSNRADIIIVSKCPKVLSPLDKRRITYDLKPKSYQEIFFTYIDYGQLTPFNEKAKIITNKPNGLLLVTGIVKPEPLFYYLKNKYQHITHLKFADHHAFNNNDIDNIINTYKSMYGTNKIIVTTEKDLMRLSLPETQEKLSSLPLYYIPIEVMFHGNDKNEFDNKILKYVTANTSNSILSKK